MRGLLPTRKRYYTRALAAAYTKPIAVPTAAAICLLDADTLEATSDTATRMMAAAVEAWLTGAADAGTIIDTAVAADVGRLVTRSRH